MGIKFENGQLSAFDSTYQSHSANLDAVAAAEVTAAGAALLDDADAAAQRTTLSAAARTQVFAIDRLVEVAADKVYTLVLNARHGGVITSTTTKCASGTATATFKVNATALGGTANAVSSTEQTQAHATNGTFVAGDDITMTVSANSTCLDLAVSVLYTRVMA
jgi:hypothetical protein